MSFVCAAQGFSQLEWKVQKQGEETVESCISKCGLCMFKSASEKI